MLYCSHRRHSFNYGDQNTNPFVQLVTTTPDPNTAMQEFQQQRGATLAKLPPTVDPSAVANKEGEQTDSTGPSTSQTAAPGSQSSSSAGASSTSTAQNGQATDANKKNGATRASAMWTGVYGGFALYMFSSVFVL